MSNEAPPEGICWRRDEHDRMYDRATPVDLRLEFWWGYLAAWIDVTHGPWYAIRDDQCRSALHHLSLAIVDAGLVDWVVALSDPLEVGGRGLALDLLKRYVLVARYHPEHLIDDQKLCDLRKRVIDFDQGALAHSARQVLSIGLRSEVLSQDATRSVAGERGKGLRGSGEAPAKPKLNKAERETLIGDALKKRMAPAKNKPAQWQALAATITLDDIEADTKIPRSTVHESAAWKTFDQKRQKVTFKRATPKPPRQISAKMLAARPDPAARTPDDEAAEREDVEARYRSRCAPDELARFEAMTPAEQREMLDLVADHDDDDGAN